VDLYYDGAMRLAGERHHDPLGVLVDDIAYEYDAAGNRIARSSAAGRLDYACDAGYRLISAAGTAGSEAYTTDPGGRVTGIARGGRSLGLAYDAADRATAVTDLGAGTTTAYVYAGEHPLLRLGPGGPVYYLTDGMGSSAARAPAA
jgi:YD repeat-containing protein